MKSWLKMVLLLLAMVVVSFDTRAERWYSPSTGKWLSRDPIGEKGGLNLYGFVNNDGVNKIDYLGLDVGTITVVENHSLGGFFTIGWVMKLRWMPPASWKGFGPGCLPCTKAIWGQDRDYVIKYKHWRKDVDTGWGTDWDETDYAGSSIPWLASTSRAPDATMHDEPAVAPSYNINYVNFHAISKVKCICIEGRDKGQIYGTVAWGYYDYLAGDTEISGGGLGSFF